MSMNAQAETVDPDIIDRAIQIIVRLQDASTRTLQSALQINSSTAEAVLEGLRECGIVTARNTAGVREVSAIWKASVRN
jgi:ribosomal protein S25